ncbi:MAG: hypothetical protein U0586_17230 [Candidatus Brocadiaceae bacterium]
MKKNLSLPSYIVIALFLSLRAERSNLSLINKMILIRRMCFINERLLRSARNDKAKIAPGYRPRNDKYGNLASIWFLK